MEKEKNISHIEALFVEAGKTKKTDDMAK